MADEEVKQEIVEEVKPETPAEPAQEELPLAAEEAPKEEIKAEEPAKAEEPKPEIKLPNWADKELKKKHAQIQEFKRQLAEKEAELEAAKALRPRDPEGKFVSAQPEVVSASEVDRRAQQIVAKQKYDEDCNKTAQVGQERYQAEWREAISNLETLGGFDPDTMTGLLATDDPAKVLYELGKNPEHYHRIMELPVPRRIVEMGKIAMSQTPQKKVSEAPAPVAPVGGRAAPARETLSDTMDDDKWFPLRRKQRFERLKAEGRIK